MASGNSSFDFIAAQTLKDCTALRSASLKCFDWDLNGPLVLCHQTVFQLARASKIEVLYQSLSIVDPPVLSWAPLSEVDVALYLALVRKIAIARLSWAASSRSDAIRHVVARHPRARVNLQNRNRRLNRADIPCEATARNERQSSTSGAVVGLTSGAGGITSGAGDGTVSGTGEGIVSGDGKGAMSGGGIRTGSGSGEGTTSGAGMGTTSGGGALSLGIRPCASLPITRALPVRRHGLPSAPDWRFHTPVTARPSRTRMA